MKAGIALLALLLLAVLPETTAADEITWKPVTAAVLKVDERPAKIWNVYTADKRGSKILVQLGQRFLMLDTDAREVWELDPATLKRKGTELRGERANAKSGEAQRSQRKGREILLPTEDWLMRDAGRARRIRVRLGTEGRVLEVQLPLQPDLRSLY